MNIKDICEAIEWLSDEKKIRHSIRYLRLNVVKKYIRSYKNYKNLSDQLKKIKISEESDRIIDNIVKILPEKQPFEPDDGLIQHLLTFLYKKLKDRLQSYLDNSYYSSLSKWTTPRISYPSQLKQLLNKYHTAAQDSLKWKTDQYHFDRVNHELQTFTKKLREKYGPAYSFAFRLDESLSQRDTIFPNYDQDQMKRDGILCVMHKDRCVSSILMAIDEENKSMVEWYSKTHEDYRNSGFNTMLRALSIIICPILNPRIEKIKSDIINPISEKILVQYFKFNKIEQSDDDLFKNTIYELEINKQSIENAKMVFQTVLEKKRKHPILQNTRDLKKMRHSK